MKELIKLIGYCRVSTDRQKEEGTIEIQEKALKEYAKKNNIELLQIFKDEAISGSSELENRPGLAKLFNYIESHFNIEGVLIFKLDRLARDLYIQEHLFKKLELLNIKLLSIKEPNLDSKDPMRKAFRQFMGIVSELEKAFITMRLSGGRINKAQKGGFAGGSTALGYISKNKKLIIDKEQAETIRMIFKMKRYKKMSLRGIARELNNLNIPTSGGKGKWHGRTIKYILENPIYKGIAHYKEIKVKNIDLALL
ncbi:recombinase family protein [Candidatus Atribacteria bacterium 1244-E10-H5-B2]|nr:MAG: recombinase family protein [Candidatus Atribacteria bacterium 1244-E10-H5-B2]